MNVTLVFVDNVDHANSDLIASHIVTFLFNSSADNVGVVVSSLTSGWATISGWTSGWASTTGSEFSIIHVLVSSIHTVFSSIQFSDSISHVSSNVISQVSLITSPVHSNTYITSHVSTSLSSFCSDLNWSFIYDIALSLIRLSVLSSCAA